MSQRTQELAIAYILQLLNLKVLVVHTTKIPGNQTCTAGLVLMTFTIVATYKVSSI